MRRRRRPRMIAPKTAISLLALVALGLAIGLLARVLKLPPPLILPEAFNAAEDDARRAGPGNALHKVDKGARKFVAPPEAIAGVTTPAFDLLMNPTFDAAAPCMDVFGLVSDPHRADVGTWLRENADALHLARRAGRAEYFLHPHPPASLAPDNDDSTRNNLLVTLVGETTRRMLTGDSEAADWLKDTLRLVRMASAEAGRQYPYRGLEITLYRVVEQAAARLDDDLLRALQEVIVELGAPWPEPVAILEQYWHKLDWDMMYVPEQTAVFRRYMFRVLYLREVQSWVEQTRALRSVLEEAAALPAAEAENLLKNTPQFPYRYVEFPPSRREGRRRLMTNLILLVHAAEVKLRYHGAALALALHRYQHHHGELPASFAALVDAGLAEVPRDPFTGNDYLGARGPAGWNLFSAGRDGKDNGGRPGADMLLWERPIE